MGSVPLGAVGSVIFTVDSTEAGRAGTGVAVDTVSAVGSVPTRVALTLVDVLLALCAPKAGEAGTQEAVHLVLTEASVAAGVCGRRDKAFDLVCVFRSLLSKGREAGERTGLAVVDVIFAVASTEARFAATAVTAQSVLAGRSIATGILHTFFDVHLTCLALVKGRESKRHLLFEWWHIKSKYE